MTISQRLMDSATTVISVPDVNEGNILKSLGVPAGKAEDHLILTISELISYCKEICKPHAACSIFPKPGFIKSSDSMVLCDETFALHKMVSSALKGSTSVAVFIGTCGDEVESFSKMLLKKKDMLEGFIVDLIGSEIAEGVADYIHNRVIQEYYETGLGVTNRYSPGYCNWPVNDQKQLFKIMGDNTCGVSLSDSCLMQPIKSVSGIIGIGPGVINREYACAYCEADHCLYRDKKP